MTNELLVGVFANNSGSIFCEVPAGQVTCSTTNHSTIAPATLFWVAVSAQGGGALPKSVGFGFELG